MVSFILSLFLSTPPKHTAMTIIMLTYFYGACVAINVTIFVVSSIEISLEKYYVWHRYLDMRPSPGDFAEEGSEGNGGGSATGGIDSKAIVLYDGRSVFILLHEKNKVPVCGKKRGAEKNH